jgi:hypothetical protein
MVPDGEREDEIVVREVRARAGPHVRPVDELGIGGPAASRQCVPDSRGDAVGKACSRRWSRPTMAGPLCGSLTLPGGGGVRELCSLGTKGGRWPCWDRAVPRAGVCCESACEGRLVRRVEWCGSQLRAPVCPRWRVIGEGLGWEVGAERRRDGCWRGSWCLKETAGDKSVTPEGDNEKHNVFKIRDFLAQRLRMGR